MLSQESVTDSKDPNEDQYRAMAESEDRAHRLFCLLSERSEEVSFKFADLKMGGQNF